MSQFDVAVIGSGLGGYVFAIRCAQLGMNTVMKNIALWEGNLLKCRFVFL